MAHLFPHPCSVSLLQRSIAAMLFVLAAPLFFTFAVLIRAHSPGPLFFMQWREGFGGRPFRMVKLRTMRCDAGTHLQRMLRESADLRSEWEKFGCLRCDYRVAGPIARLARTLSIDEIPQFLNVLRGEMVLVGPRPLPPEIASSLSRSALEKRRTVFPGVTGLWQVCGRSDLSLRCMGQLDKLYVKNQCWRLDMWIVARTVVEVIRGRGAN
ncbi:MAG: sugar transferase [Pseudomonadota bacterium]